MHGENKKDRDRFIAAADYHGSAKGWAESCGFDYYSARTKEEFEKCLPEFVSMSKKPIILEAFVSDNDESEAYLKIVNENKTKTTRDSVKSAVKGIIGEKAFKKLKSTIKG